MQRPCTRLQLCAIRQVARVSCRLFVRGLAVCTQPDAGAIFFILALSHNRPNIRSHACAHFLAHARTNKRTQTVSDLDVCTRARTHARGHAGAHTPTRTHTHARCVHMCDLVTLTQTNTPTQAHI